VTLPEAIDQRRKKIYDTLHHTYTNEEIQSMVEKNSGAVPSPSLFAF
jgi:hypothetical protein